MSHSPPRQQARRSTRRSSSASNSSSIPELKLGTAPAFSPADNDNDREGAGEGVELGSLARRHRRVQSHSAATSQERVAGSGSGSASGSRRYSDFLSPTDLPDHRQRQRLRLPRSASSGTAREPDVPRRHSRRLSHDQALEMVPTEPENDLTRGSARSLSANSSNSSGSGRRKRNQLDILLENPPWDRSEGFGNLREEAMNQNDDDAKAGRPRRALARYRPAGLHDLDDGEHLEGEIGTDIGVGPFASGLEHGLEDEIIMEDSTDLVPVSSATNSNDPNSNPDSAHRHSHKRKRSDHPLQDQLQSIRAVLDSRSQTQGHQGSGEPSNSRLRLPQPGSEGPVELVSAVPVPGSASSSRSPVRRRPRLHSRSANNNQGSFVSGITGEELDDEIKYETREAIPRIRPEDLILVSDLSDHTSSVAADDTRTRSSQRRAKSTSRGSSAPASNAGVSQVRSSLRLRQAPRTDYSAMFMPPQEGDPSLEVGGDIFPEAGEGSAMHLDKVGRDDFIQVRVPRSVSRASVDTQQVISPSSAETSVSSAGPDIRATHTTGVRSTRPPSQGISPKPPQRRTRAGLARLQAQLTASSHTSVEVAEPAGGAVSSPSASSMPSLESMSEAGLNLSMRHLDLGANQGSHASQGGHDNDRIAQDDEDDGISPARSFDFNSVRWQNSQPQSQSGESTGPTLDINEYTIVPELPSTSGSATLALATRPRRPSTGRRRGRDSSAVSPTEQLTCDCPSNEHFEEPERSCTASGRPCRTCRVELIWGTPHYGDSSDRPKLTLMQYDTDSCILYRAAPNVLQGEFETLDLDKLTELMDDETNNPDRDRVWALRQLRSEHESEA